MAKSCKICEKTSMMANKVCFSNKHHKHRQNVNLQSVKAVLGGTVKRIDVCTSCIKANKVQKAK